jgi:hypothetical protein
MKEWWNRSWRVGEKKTIEGETVQSWTATETLPSFPTPLVPSFSHTNLSLYIPSLLLSHYKATPLYLSIASTLSPATPVLASLSLLTNSYVIQNFPLLYFSLLHNATGIPTCLKVNPWREGRGFCSTLLHLATGVSILTPLDSSISTLLPADSSSRSVFSSKLKRRKYRNREIILNIQLWNLGARESQLAPENLAPLGNMNVKV